MEAAKLVYKIGSHVVIVADFQLKLKIYLNMGF